MTGTVFRDTRITDIAVSGYKDADWTYQLAPGTVLSGPNGSGKSTALEALRYVLTGQVPAGKALDVVARYFPPTGGGVLVRRADGASAKRGITIDHDKAKVSEFEEVTEGSTWRADPVVLDLQAFLALSPAKRREYVLELCGSSDTPDTKAILDEIDLEYARVVGGPAATPGIYLQLEQLPRDLAVRLEAYQGPRGPREVLASCFSPGQTTASLCLLLRDQAKQERLAHGRAAKEAHQAVKKLAEAAKGVEAAAALLADARAAHESAFAALNAGRSLMAKRREAEAGKDAATKRREAAVSQLEALKEEVKTAADPGPEPAAPTTVDVDSDLDRAHELDARARDARVAMENRAELATMVARTRKELEAQRAELSSLRGGQVGMTLEIIGRIPDDVHELMPRLRELVSTLGRSNLDRQATVEASIARLVGYLADHESRWSEADRNAPGLEAEFERLRKESESIRAAVQLRVSAHRLAITNHEAQLAEWKRRKQLFDTGAKRVAEAEARAQEAWDAEDAAITHWQGIVEPVMFDLEAAFRQASAKLDTAQEAAAQLRAYQEAEARAEREKLLEEVWKATEAALAVVQEKVVGSAALPLVAALNDFLAAAGREERAYLELENDRGRPIFDIGWIAGDARVPIQAMSGGEAVLFGAGLSLAIAQRSEGLRVLLVEADPLDKSNLHQLFHGLTPFLGELDACLVSTARDLGEVGGEGWSLITNLPGRRLAPAAA